jgi:hypothetical protein
LAFELSALLARGLEVLGLPLKLGLALGKLRLCLRPAGIELRKSGRGLGAELLQGPFRRGQFLARFSHAIFRGRLLLAQLKQACVLGGHLVLVGLVAAHQDGERGGQGGLLCF